MNEKEKREKTWEVTNTVKQKKSRLFLKLACMMVSPILFFGILLVGMAAQSISDAMQMEMKTSLAGIAREAALDYAEHYLVEYPLTDGVYQGVMEDAEERYVLLERLKANTGADITIFYGKDRVLTTILDRNGNRIPMPSQVDARIYATVFEGGEYFSTKVKISRQPFYGYYVPLYFDGEICGMVFAGVSSRSIDTSRNELVSRIVLIFAAAVVIVLGITELFAKSLVQQLNAIRDYIGGLAENRLDGRLPDKLLERQDEIGDLGRYSVEVGNRIKTMISSDPLTGLLNRRATKVVFDEWLKKSVENELPFQVAMADIDFFKKVNDTYGHQYGDEVLLKLAEIFKRKVGKQGFVSRWGGEEFLIGLPMEMADAKRELEDISDEIRAVRFVSKGQEFHITITVGLASFAEGMDRPQLIAMADQRLYRGKIGRASCRERV